MQLKPFMEALVEERHDVIRGSVEQKKVNLHSGHTYNTTRRACVKLNTVFLSRRIFRWLWFRQIKRWVKRTLLPNGQNPSHVLHFRRVRSPTFWGWKKNKHTDRWTGTDRQTHTDERTDRPEAGRGRHAQTCTRRNKQKRTTSPRSATHPTTRLR